MMEGSRGRVEKMWDGRQIGGLLAGSRTLAGAFRFE